MNNSDQLTRALREWVDTKKKIARIRRELKIQTDTFKRVSDSLTQIMQSNGIDEFSIQSGIIRCKTRNVKKPIGVKMLDQSLSTYFDGDLEAASQLNSFILSQRETKVVHDIVQVVQKPK